MIVRDEPEMKSLNIGRDELAAIVLLARAYDVQVSPSTQDDDGSNAADDGQTAALEDRPDNPVGAELSTAIASLNVDAQIDLVTLVWLGRGDFDDWEEARAMAAERRRDGPTARYLLNLPLLGDLIEEGAEAVGVNLAEEEAQAMIEPANGEI